MDFSESLINEPSRRTPWVVLEPGRLFIMGRSIPENPSLFFRPIYEWVLEYAKNDTHRTKIEFGFEYINTASTKWIYSILKELGEMVDPRENLSIRWYYEEGDDDMGDLGNMLCSLIECSYSVIEVGEMNMALYKRFYNGSLY